MRAERSERAGETMRVLKTFIPLNVADLNARMKDGT
jgi:hypothetical protein